MAVGPVDVVIIGFPGNKFTGQIAPAIMDLVDSGTIRVIDLLFVMKDADGVITTIEAKDLDPETGPSFLAIDVAQPGALGAEDAEEVSDDLPLNSSALLIAFENAWAAKFVAAVQAADAVVIDQIRIPADVVEAVLTATSHQPSSQTDLTHETERSHDMGLLRMATRTAVVAGTATAVSGRVARRQANKYDQQDAAAGRAVRGRRPQQYAPPPASARAARGRADRQAPASSRSCTPRASSPTRSSRPPRPRSSGSDRAAAS